MPLRIPHLLLVSHPLTRVRSVHTPSHLCLRDASRLRRAASRGLTRASHALAFLAVLLLFVAPAFLGLTVDETVFITLRVVVFVFIVVEVHLLDRCAEALEKVGQRARLRRLVVPPCMWSFSSRGCTVRVNVSKVASDGVSGSAAARAGTRSRSTCLLRAPRVAARDESMAARSHGSIRRRHSRASRPP